MTTAFIFDSLRHDGVPSCHGRQRHADLRADDAPMVGLSVLQSTSSRQLREGRHAAGHRCHRADPVRDAQCSRTALKLKANQLFKTLINRPEIQNIVVTPVLYTPEESTFRLTVDATGKVDTTFTKIIGKQNLDLSVNTEIKWGVKKLELALGLDNTGSMGSSSKMTALKKALLNIKVRTAQRRTACSRRSRRLPRRRYDIKIDHSLRHHRQVGTSYKNDTWLDWTEVIRHLQQRP
jgi:hypothetical protein